MDRRLANPWLNRAHYPLDWNGPIKRPFASFPAEDLERPIIELFVEAARAHPDATAVDDGQTRLSYSDLLARVALLAARLAMDTAPGDRIGALVPASSDFPVALFACLAAGRLFVPLDLHYPKAWIGEALETAGVAVVLGRFDAEADAMVPSAIRRIDLDAEASVEAAPFTPVGPDAPAVIIFTSGSTGRPKGIVNSQRNLLRRVEQYRNAAHVGPDDRFMPLSSGCTIAGLRERLTALLTGASLYPLDVQRAGAGRILDRLEETGTTMIYAVPALLRALIDLAPKGPSALKVVRVGGDAVLWSDVDLFRGWLPAGCRIELGYSSSEAPILQWFVPENFPRDGSRVPIGYPLEDGELAILDDDGACAAPGEIGELVVRTAYVALGHWREGALDASPFPPSPEDPTRRILNTGDLVRLRNDGLIDLVGRKDRMVKIRGIRVEPGEVEAALRAQTGVADVAVLPRRIGQNVSLIGYVVPRADAPADLVSRLREALKPALPAHMQPQRIYSLSAIPRLPSAKLDIKALEVLDRARQTDEDRPRADKSVAIAEPDGPTECAIAAIWSRLFARASIDRNADFFDLGGDSLLTMNLMFALERELGVDLPVTMIFEAPTIAALARAIEAKVVPAFSPLVLMKPGEGIPIFIVHGVGGTVMELFALGRRLEHAGPVYALQARGLDGSAPNRSVATMAEDYLGAISAVFPQGPYHLAGYSSGGLIAYEMAQRLSPDAVASLTLLDTQTNARQWPLSVWLDVMRRRWRHHQSGLAGQALSQDITHTALAIGGLWRRLAWRVGLVSSPRTVELPPALGAVYSATLAAVAAYRPSRYTQPLTLIVSEAGDPMMADPARIWPRYAPCLTIWRTPGDHYSMIQGDNASKLAALIELERASQNRPSNSGD